MLKPVMKPIFQKKPDLTFGMSETTLPVIFASHLIFSSLSAITLIMSIFWSTSAPKPLYIAKTVLLRWQKKPVEKHLIGRKNWPDIGQCEAEAYDNYVELNKIGVRVAILNYVAYHDRFLLCDFVDKVKELRRYFVTTDTETGSRTPYINFDVTPMRTIQEFLEEEHPIPSGSMTPYFEAMCSQLQRQLPTRHHRKSPLKRVTDLYLSGASLDRIVAEATISVEEINKHINYLTRIGITPEETF